MSRLIRVGRRKASWRSDRETILNEEFRARDAPAGQFDLAPSVYEIDDSREQLIRTHAEHTAGSGLDPPRWGSAADVHGLWPDLPAVVAGTGPFAFTRNAHREFNFASSDQIIQFVDRFVQDRANRVHDIEKAEVASYVVHQLDNGDAEWTGHCQTHPRWAEWVQKQGSSRG